ncbi:MAG TPA: DUF4350 domain-containing protein [Candidatus Rubrimentiphilum sp.]|nr:DUF4350 domain-containing protein [Candidatus Rubrimentiphilum sp.]
MSVAIVLLIVVSFLRSQTPQTHQSFPSTYDSGAYGYAALYEFLQRERVAVQRFELPLGELPARSTLVIAGDYVLDEAAPSATAQRTLAAWVRGGGTLIVLGKVSSAVRQGLGLPASSDRMAGSVVARTGCGFQGSELNVRGEFTRSLPADCGSAKSVLLRSGKNPVAVALDRGRGRVVEFTTPTIFDNLRLAQGDNARFAYDLFSAKTVAFDERVYGYAQGRTFWEVLPQPVHIAIFVALGALLLAIIGANLPFAPPYRIEAQDERDSSDYILSLARMLQRGGAAREVVAKIFKAASALAPRSYRGDGAAAGFDELQLLSQRHDLRAHDVLRAGTLYAQLRKDYE